ncbi:MAG: lipoprotein [Alphaproteobacteria bacterium]|nr:lipoprotein [Alphaproteobacteria bacterium]
MKKMFLTLLSLLVLSSCTGVRGFDGNGMVCENSTWMGLSIIELISPCMMRVKNYTREQLRPRTNYNQREYYR